MRRLHCVFAALLLASAVAPTAFTQVAPLSPPVAKIVPRVDTLHGDVLVDNYAWLRDDARTRADVIGYLNAENAFTEAKSASLAPLREKLFAEFMGRIKQTDLQVPERDGPFLYYTRTVEGKQYSIFARKRGTERAREEILLDRNERAGADKYYATGATAVSP